MNRTREEKKAEAIQRMKEWKIFCGTVKDFEQENLVSESVPPVGACFWVNDEQKKRIAEFEEKYDALVYHVIHSYTEFGELENYLYVSDYPEEWEDDWNDIQEHRQMCYVYNLDMPEYSEVGTIGIKITPAAGLCRIW